MRTAKAISPQHREQVPSVGMDIRPASPGKRRGWRQWLCQWYAGYLPARRRREVPRRLYGLWDAQHEQMQVQATEGHLDYVTRTRPALSMVIYTALVCSYQTRAIRALSRRRRTMRQSLVCSLVMLTLLSAPLASYPAERTAALWPIAPVGSTLQPVLTTTELSVGQNRLAFGLLLNHTTFVAEAAVVVRVHALQDAQPRLQAETRAFYEPLASHASGLHAASEVRGIYVTQVTFDRPGPWGLEVLVAQDDGPVAVSRFTVEVRAVPQTPVLGAPAPQSRHLIPIDISGERQGGEMPDPPWVCEGWLAEAIAQGKPQVLVFATPKFCTSPICGPVLEAVWPLLAAYADRVVFAQQELWQNRATQRRVRAVEEWHLPSEPWIFVVDGEGIVRAKFEGMTTERELASALQEMLKRE